MKRDQLISLYEDAVKTSHGYEDMNAYVARREAVYRKYCIGKTPSEQATVWLKLLSDDFGRNVANLGCYLALRENDMSLLERALASASSWGQLTMSDGGCDHSIYAWTVLPLVLGACRFDDIDRMIPAQNGLSENGLSSSRVIVNLVMLLHYRESSWEDSAVKAAESLLKTRCTIEEKAVTSCLLALVREDWNTFSISLDQVSAAKRKSREYGESGFTRQVSFMAIGLHNYARHLYGNDVPVPSNLRDDLVFGGYTSYLDHVDNRKNAVFHTFEGPLELLNLLESMDRPAMHLTEGPKRALDISRYRSEILDRLRS